MKEENKNSVAALVFGVIIVGAIMALYIGTHIALINAIKEKKQEKMVAKAAAMNAPITDENNNLYR